MKRNSVIIKLMIKEPLLRLNKFNDMSMIVAEYENLNNKYLKVLVKN